MKAKVLKTVYDIGVQVGRKTYSLNYEIPFRTRAENLFRKYKNGQICHERFNTLIAKRGAKVVLLSRDESDWKVVTTKEPNTGDTLERLAEEAHRLVDSIGLNPPFEVEDGIDGVETCDNIVDNDCDRPCLMDVTSALNLVVRLAALHKKGGEE